MNEPTTTLTEFSDDDDVFAEVIYEIVESKHKKYERQHRESGASRVPLENISIMLKDFEDFVHVMRGIRPLQLPDSTAREMLNAFWEKGELIPAEQRDAYRLSKTGVLYKDLKEILGITQ